MGIGKEKRAKGVWCQERGLLALALELSAHGPNHYVESGEVHTQVLK